MKQYHNRTKEEDDYILENFGKKSQNEIRDHLKVHADTLNRRCKTLGFDMGQKFTRRLQPKMERPKPVKVTKEFPPHFYDKFGVFDAPCSSAECSLIKQEDKWT